MTDSVGNVVESYRYTVYGQSDKISNIGNSYMFTGRQFDLETGLYYYRARYYSPAIGRFLQTDPVGYTDSYNLYTYCGNNPTNHTDAHGLWVGVDDAIFAGVGAILGVASQGISDLIAGELSGWEEYTGAALGGAASGEVFLYTANPTLAGAAGGAVESTATQGLKIASGEMKVSEFSIVEVGKEAALGAVFGKLSGAKIPGISSGKGSYGAITGQMITKFQTGQISSVSGKTLGKMATYYGVETLTSSTVGSGITGGIGKRLVKPIK